MQHNRLTVRKTAGTTIAELLDERIDRLDPQAIDEISNALLALVPPDAPICLLVDFTQVQFMGSALLGTLIRLSKRTTENGGSLKICGLTPNIAKMLAMIKMDQILDIYKNHQAALEKQ